MEIIELIDRVENKEITLSNPVWVFDYFYEAGQVKRVDRHIPPQLCFVSYRLAAPWGAPYWKSNIHNYSVFSLLNKSGKPLRKTYTVHDAKFFLTEDECKYEYEKACIENVRRLEEIRDNTNDLMNKRIDEVKKNLAEYGKP